MKKKLEDICKYATLRKDIKVYKEYKCRLDEDILCNNPKNYKWCPYIYYYKGKDKE